ncbi:mycofactocin-coupled SDR family oxidoreductase [Catenuloplanes japonicus]|uniref:mycofactocin-coupled SDR family oxidoreductase n=1 Tax=Catenuloplanes japonicus TaxID=33876 RepID=UPI0005267D8C|nr:mycofactocin-coupled SDR family oxidoreductase [Catenuloplanes japonicus]
MAGRLQDRVALVTGAARGQGRGIAVRLAQEGADIIAVDIAAPIESVFYPLATPEDLAGTVAQVEALGRRAVLVTADVRDFGTLDAAVGDAVARLGRLDIVAANAAVYGVGTVGMPEQTWQDMIDVNLTGVWHTVKAAVPHLRAGDDGGSIVITGSAASLRPYPEASHYVAAKHGIVGLTRSLALELGPDRIRVNSVHPTGVDTPMIHNPSVYALFAPDLPEHERTRETLAGRFQTVNVLPIPWIDPVDIANAVLWLSTEEARYVTGVALPIDAGASIK